MPRRDLTARDRRGVCDPARSGLSRAEERLEKGEIAADEIGLTPLTSNKHYRKLAQAHAFLRAHVPGLPALNFSEFTQPDRKDERTARLRYPLEQGGRSSHCRHGQAARESRSGSAPARSSSTTAFFMCLSWSGIQALGARNSASSGSSMSIASTGSGSSV